MLGCQNEIQCFLYLYIVTRLLRFEKILLLNLDYITLGKFISISILEVDIFKDIETWHEDKCQYQEKITSLISCKIHGQAPDILADCRGTKAQEISPTHQNPYQLTYNSVPQTARHRNAIEFV